MSDSNYEKPNIVSAIFIFYLIPLFALTLYSADIFSPERSWEILSIGLFLASIGSLASYVILNKWEKSRPVTTQYITPEVPNLEETVTKLQSELESTQNELSQKKEEIDKLLSEKNQVVDGVEKVSEEYLHFKTVMEEELHRKEAQLAEYQDAVAQQRDVIKKRQEQIAELEGKVNDLHFEVKTLIDVANLSETLSGIQVQESASNYQSSPTQVRTSEDATLQLRKCIDISQKITGANHFESSNSRYRDWNMDNYALDLRRLFDSLRSETTCTIFVFSQKDNKLLFVNNQAKNLLGWTPEKFIQNFQEIVQESIQDWNRGIIRLASMPETETQLLLKSKSGQTVSAHCRLGLIPTGIFRNHIIGVIYTDSVHNYNS